MILPLPLFLLSQFTKLPSSTLHNPKAAANPLIGSWIIDPIRPPLAATFCRARLRTMGSMKSAMRLSLMTVMIYIESGVLRM